MQRPEHGGLRAHLDRSGCAGHGVPHVTVVQPYKVKKSIEAIRDGLDFKGVSVVISQEMRTLYAKSLKNCRRKPFQVTDKCRNHRDCMDDLACPAFYLERTDQNRRRTCVRAAPSAPRSVRKTPFCRSRRNQSPA